MKKVKVLGLVLLLVGLFFSCASITQLDGNTSTGRNGGNNDYRNNLYIIQLDFSADQSNNVHNNEYIETVAAYLINTTDIPLTFQYDYKNNIDSDPPNYQIIGTVRILSEPFIYITTQIEVPVIDNVNRDNVEVTTEIWDYFTLYPGEKIRIVSYYFSEENRELYPYSYFHAILFENEQRMGRVEAYIKPELYER